MHTGPPQPDLDPLLASGLSVSGWLIETVLGRGGMGEVYLVSREGNGYVQRGAMKIARTSDKTAQERFIRERQLLSALEHPNIARLIEGGEDEDIGAYMVVEFISGDPLTVYATNLPVAERLALFCELCSAVAHAHAGLILHRDIKPANVLVTSERRVRLIDFGVGQDLSDATSDAHAPTTTAYAAPEQLAGRPATTATDIHAMGILLFELLTGARPGPVRPVAHSSLDADLTAIINTCIASDQSHRYASVSALSDDISRYLTHQPVTARKGGPDYHLRKRIQRYPLASAASMLFVLALIGGIIGTSVMAAQARSDARRATLAAEKAEKAERAQAFEARTLTGYRTALQSLYRFDELPHHQLDAAIMTLVEEARTGFLAGSTDDGYHLYAIAQNFMHKDDYVSAQKTLEPFLTHPSNDPFLNVAARSELARCYAETGQAVAAADLAEEIIREKRDIGDYSAASILQDQMIIAENTNDSKDWERVIATAEQAIDESDPGAVSTLSFFYNQIGSAAFQLSQTDRAIDAFASAFELKQQQAVSSPNDITAAENLALLMIYLQGDGARPLEFLKAYSELAELRFGSRLQAGFIDGLRAEASLLVGDIPGALESAESALILLENDQSYRSGFYHQTLTMKARALARYGQVEEAKLILYELDAHLQAPDVQDDFDDTDSFRDMKIRMDLAQVEVGYFSGEVSSPDAELDRILSDWDATQTDGTPFPLGVMTLLNHVRSVTQS